VMHFELMGKVGVKGPFLESLACSYRT